MLLIFYNSVQLSGHVSLERNSWYYLCGHVKSLVHKHKTHN